MIRFLLCILILTFSATSHATIFINDSNVESNESSATNSTGVDFGNATLEFHLAMADDADYNDVFTLPDAPDAALAYIVGVAGKYVFSKNNAPSGVPLHLYRNILILEVFSTGMTDADPEAATFSLKDSSSIVVNIRPGCPNVDSRFVADCGGPVGVASVAGTKVSNGVVATIAIHMDEICNKFIDGAICNDDTTGSTGNTTVTLTLELFADGSTIKDTLSIKIFGSELGPIGLPSFALDPGDGQIYLDINTVNISAAEDQGSVVVATEPITCGAGWSQGLPVLIQHFADPTVVTLQQFSFIVGGGTIDVAPLANTSDCYAIAVAMANKAGVMGIPTAGFPDAQESFADQVVGLRTQDDCFIATAAWGSKFEPHVATLRLFRDKVLAPFSLGQWLIDSYYRLSPPMANWISTSPKLKKLFQIILYPLFLVGGGVGAQIGGVMGALVTFLLLMLPFFLFGMTFRILTKNKKVSTLLLIFGFSLFFSSPPPQPMPNPQRALKENWKISWKRNLKRFQKLMTYNRSSSPKKRWIKLSPTKSPLY